MKSHIPNILTIMNLLCGFLSIVFVAQGNFFYGVTILFLCFVFDLLDGLVARRLNVTSKIGIELDSLADGVSFVVSPAFIVYFYFFKNYLGLVVSFVILAFGMLRLAKFNLSKDKGYFEGMSTPYFSAIIIGLFFIDYPFNEYILAVFLILAAYAMVSKLRFPNLKQPEFGKFKGVGIVLLALFFVGFFTLNHTLLALLFQICILLFAGLMFRYSRKWKPLALFIIALFAISLYTDYLKIANLMIGAPILGSIMLSPLIEMSK